MLPLGTVPPPEEFQTMIVKPPAPQTSAVTHTEETLEKLEQLRKLAGGTFTDIENLLEKHKQDAMSATTLETATAIANLFINVKKVCQSVYRVEY